MYTEHGKCPEKARTGSWSMDTEASTILSFPVCTNRWAAASFRDTTSSRPDRLHERLLHCSSDHHLAYRKVSIWRVSVSSRPFTSPSFILAAGAFDAQCNSESVEARASSIPDYSRRCTLHCIIAATPAPRRQLSPAASMIAKLTSCFTHVEFQLSLAGLRRREGSEGMNGWHEPFAR